MSQKFHGTIDELKRVVKSTGIQGEWQSDRKGMQTFRTAEGGILNWWSNGTIQFQGKPDAKAVFEQTVNCLLSEPSNSNSSMVKQNVSETATVKQPQNRLMDSCEVSSLLKRIKQILANSGLTVMPIDDSTYIVRESGYNHCCSLMQRGPDIYIRGL